MSILVFVSASILVFLLTFGLMWIIGQHVLAVVFSSLPPLEGAWGDRQNTLQLQIEGISLWLVPVMALIVFIKAIMWSSGRGAD